MSTKPKPEARKVYVVESGDYEQRGIFLIADSPEAARAAVKATYAPPYIVEWSDESDDGMRGTFQSVRGYAIAHVGYYDITEYEVESLGGVTRSQ